jgi:serine/threonine protein kinase/tetratricopeptide (TPR) repeat protein
LINFEPSLAYHRYTTVYGSVNPACVLGEIKKLAIEIKWAVCYNAEIPLIFSSLPPWPLIMEGTTMLEVRLLGKFAVTLAGRPIEIPSHPGQLLLAYLLLNAGKTHRREKLAGLLWPDSDEANARNNLRQTLWRLRQTLGEDYILADKISVEFNPEVDYQLDVDLLLNNAENSSTDELIRIASAYQGSLLPGFYEDWVILEQERLQAVFEHKMQLLLNRLVEDRRWSEVLAWGERWIALGQTPEPAYRALMLAHAGLGDRSNVVAVYQRCIKALQQELGVEPSEQTRQLYERLLSAEEAASEPSVGFAGLSGQAVGSYRLVEQIGTGGMAEVYKAYQPRLDRYVAVKFIKPELVTSGNFRSRFEREAKLMAQLNHPHIVHVYDFGETGHHYYLVMEYVAGGTLKEWLKKNRQTGPGMAPEQVTPILRQISAALDFAHQQGIIHRDLKPSNIMLTPDGRALLADFGLAKLIDGSGDLSQTGSTTGTPAYMSPEQVEGDLDKIGPASDLYALGVVLYELVTGQLPFSADSSVALMFKHVNEAAPSPRSLNPDLSEALEQVLLKALAKEPAERYQRAGELAAAFAAALVSRPLPAPSPPIGPDPLPARRPAFFGNEIEPIEVERGIFIGRERELARLNEFLAKILGGWGQVAFVIGEAGQGKTSLLRQFARQAQDDWPELIVATGSSDIYTGVGDPYLPFREIMSRLTGDVETQWAAGTITGDHAARLWRLWPHAVQALVDHGPNLIDTFISGAALEARFGQDLPGTLRENLAGLKARLQELRAQKAARSGDHNLQQDRLFEEYSSVLKTLATQQPLILLLDDLHWADLSSISLLAHLARRIEDSPILVIGTYRPEDVAQGRLSASSGQREPHPLDDMLSECKRHFGDVWVDLDRTGRTEELAFVDALLDTEPNRLSESFRQQLARHTEGHPLFVVELLREMQARGKLRQDTAGYWIEGPELTWETLPARVEGVIEKRVGRLALDLREILTAACVEGETFTAEVIARAQKLDDRTLVRRLSGELDRQHRLVQEQGIRRAGAQRLSLYSFRHNLFQKYLYDSLGETERMYLHEDIGNALEGLYRDQTEEMAAIAAQLARHFQEARIAEKAIGYLLQAGERAARLSAYEEAIAHFNRGLALLEGLSKSPERVQQEFNLQLSLGKAQWKVGQVVEALSTFQRSADIARELASPEALARTALGYEEPRWRFNLPPEPIVRLLEEALTVLGEKDSALRVRVLASLARALLDTGSRERLAATVKQAVEVARRINDPVALFDALRISVQVDRQPETIAARVAALTEMVRLAEKLDDRERVVVACGLRLYDLLELGDIEGAEADMKTHVQLGEKLRHVFSLHASEVYQAMWALLKGHFEEAEQFAQQALDIGQRMGVTNVDGTFGLQMFSIRREQGRLREVAPVVKAFVAQNPAAAAWRPGLALIYSDLGLRRECREVFESLAGDNFSSLPQDSLWVTCIAYLAEVCAFLGDTDRAARLYQLLLPYDGRAVVVGSAVACYGAVSRYLGLLAATMSRWAEAERHFEAALELNARMEARPWLAHTQHHYAAMLLARGHAEDYARAISLLDEALTTAQELGMQFLIQKAEALKISTFSHS